MERKNINFLVDSILFIMILSFIFTAIILKWILPPGTGGEHRGWKNDNMIISREYYDDPSYSSLQGLGQGRGKFYKEEGCADEYGSKAKTFLGLGRHDWGTIHFYAATFFLIMLFIHLYLHWAWIKCFFKKTKDQGLKT